jgi:hypothetical protein
VDGVHPVSSATTQDAEALRRPAGVLMAAYTAEHLTHCANCRTITADLDAASAANGASMARRDRRQLGLRFSARTQEVSV